MPYKIMLLYLTNKIIKTMGSYNKEVSIKKFIKEYYTKTYIDKAYQRREVWDTKMQEKFIESVYKGFVSNPIILVNVPMCMEHARETDNKEDFKYFEEIRNKGFEYVSLDGNNRSKTINNYFNGEKLNDDNQEKETFGDKEINIVIYKDLTKKDIHELAIVTNMGNSWNEQENRNAMNTKVSVFMRDMADELNTVINHIKINKVERMKDAELLTKMLAYENMGPIKLRQKELDTLYLNQNTEITTFKKNILLIKKIMQHHTSDVKIPSSDFFNLYLIISYLNKNNMTIKNLKEFYTDFHQQQILRRNDTKTLYKSENGKIVTWSGLNGNMGLDYDLKMETILSEIDMDRLVTIKDDKRTFTLNQKIEIWKRDNGMARINNGDKLINGNKFKPKEENNFIKVTLMEALSSKWVVDHVNPHIEGGETKIENGEITSKEYNLWKNKNRYDMAY